EARTVFFKCVAMSAMYEKTSEIHALWHADHKVPEHNVEELPELPLSPVQRVGAHTSRLLPGYALFMEQGTGKTPIVISRVCADARENHERGNTTMTRVLVVCPKSVRSNWKAEFERFSTVPGKVCVLRGGQMKRVQQFARAMIKDDDELYTVVVVSYGLLVQCWSTLLSHVE